MKFAHLADCHLGGWKEEKLRDLNLQSFKEAINICIKKHTAFILISGDLFNIALPPIEILKKATEILKRAKQYNISIYLVPGSHDFSPSRKTMLDVLEKAGLVTNVFKLKDNNLEFTIDKTNTKITGLPGLKGNLEKDFYKTLNKNFLEKEQGFKIFLFHTALTEFKPKDLEKIDSESLVSLPKNFNYYAGGHIHYIFNKDVKDYGLIAFPGALFPNNFAELEKFKCGSFYIVDDKLNLEHIKINLKDVLTFKINADNKTPEDIQNEILKISEEDIKDKIITIRISGTLKSGKISDINFKNIFSNLEDAFFVMKNTSGLKTKEVREIKIDGNIEEIEEEIIEENIEPLENFNTEELIQSLMRSLNLEKNEGEKVYDFESRLIENVLKVLKIR